MAKKQSVLKQIEDFARLQFTREEVATMVGVTVFSPAHATAYMRGRLLAEAEVRKSILYHAKAGSTPAQKSYIDLVTKREKLEQRGKKTIGGLPI